MSGDFAELVVLNQGYVDAFKFGRADLYAAHVTADYRCHCPSGTIVSRADFVKSARQPMTYRACSVDSVSVQFVGPAVALIGAITPWERADGTGEPRCGFENPCYPGHGR